MVLQFLTENNKLLLELQNVVAAIHGAKNIMNFPCPTRQKAKLIYGLDYRAFCTAVQAK